MERTAATSPPPGPCSPPHPPPVCRCLPTPIGGLSSLLGSFPSPSFPSSSHQLRALSSARASRNPIFPPSSSHFSDTPNVGSLFSCQRKTQGHQETSEAFALTEQRDLSQRARASLRARERRPWGGKNSFSSFQAISHEERSSSLGEQRDKKDSFSCDFVKERNKLEAGVEGCCVEGGGVWLVRGIDLLELDIHLTW